MVSAFVECFLVWGDGLVKGCFVGRKAYVDAGGNVFSSDGRVVALAVDVL